MGMMESGLTSSDVLALMNSKDNNGLFGGGDSSWVFFLFFLLAWGGGGNFLGGGNRAAMAGYDAANAFQGALTRSDLYEGFNTQEVNSQLRGIINGISDGFYAQNAAITSGFHGVDNALCNGFYTVNNNIQQARFDAQQCCCTTQRAIDSVKYENARNTSDIVNAIKADGEATRALITANTLQDLRDKIADKDRELMTANFQLSQQAQNATLIGELRPCAKPAYITCSPYEARNYANNCGYCC